MKAKLLLLELAVWSCLLTSVVPACAQTWTLTSAPSTNWVALASSADGTKLLAAAYNGTLFTSTNSGETWTPTTAPVTAWQTVASSANGSVFVAANCCQTWFSKNSDLTWIAGVALPWGGMKVSAACSADGAKVVVGEWGFPQTAYIVTSTNSGATWATINPSSVIYWTSAASSADGAKLVVGSMYASATISLSTNSGATWRYVPAPFYPWVLASSADGNKIASTGNGTWVSADSGATWEHTIGQSGESIACSADGMKLITANGSGIFTSTNFGTTWTTNDASLYWYAVASSADGCKLVAAVNGGGIYTCQTTPMPVLNVSPAGGELLLSWIIPSQDFVLQQNTDLTTSNWTDVTNAPVLNLTNLQNQVVVPLSMSNQFFRLKNL